MKYVFLHPWFHALSQALKHVDILHRWRCELICTMPMFMAQFMAFWQTYLLHRLNCHVRFPSPNNFLGSLSDFAPKKRSCSFFSAEIAVTGSREERRRKLQRENIPKPKTGLKILGVRFFFSFSMLAARPMVAIFLRIMMSNVSAIRGRRIWVIMDLRINPNAAGDLDMKAWHLEEHSVVFLWFIWSFVSSLVKISLLSTILQIQVFFGGVDIPQTFFAGRCLQRNTRPAEWGRHLLTSEKDLKTNLFSDSTYLNIIFGCASGHETHKSFVCWPLDGAWVVPLLPVGQRDGNSGIGCQGMAFCSTNNRWSGHRCEQDSSYWQ